jgi:uncharacterized protein (TIGR02597 family)
MVEETMNSLRFLLPLIALFIVPAAQAQEATATTDPVGYVTLSIAGGSGGKAPTFLSIPLLDSANIAGQVRGLITGVSESTISNSEAGWQNGSLSDPASPYLILITSGDAQGRMFLVSTDSPNTSTQVTISADDLLQGSLLDLGVKTGDSYRIHPCDTLSSLFGTPASTGIVGGTNARVADTIVLVGPTGPVTYFYSTTENSWVENSRRVSLAPNVPLRPYYGLIYGRQSESPLEFIVTGSVPITSRSVAIANAGATILAQYWPASTKLIDLGLQNVTGWQTGANAKDADRVVIQGANGVPSVYFYNGTNWLLNARRVEISDNVEIPAGASVQIERRFANPGYSVLQQQVPYSL